MGQIGYPKNIVHILASYLEERILRVKIRKDHLRRPEAGASRGEALPPQLYALYTADFPKPNYPIDRTIMALYVYDIAIDYQSLAIGIGNERLPMHDSKLIHWFVSEALLIHCRRRYRPDQSIIMNEHRILWKEWVKYLGVIIYKLIFKKYFQEVGRKGRTKLYSLMRRKSDRNLLHKVILIRFIILPIRTYASMGRSRVQKLLNSKKISVNDVLSTRRVTLGTWSSSGIWTPITEMMRIRARNALFKGGHHQNRCLREPLDDDSRFVNRHKRLMSQIRKIRRGQQMK